MLLTEECVTSNVYVINVGSNVVMNGVKWTNNNITGDPNDGGLHAGITHSVTSRDVHMAHVPSESQAGGFYKNAKE